MRGPGRRAAGHEAKAVVEYDTTGQVSIVLTRYVPYDYDMDGDVDLRDYQREQLRAKGLP
jgi:hypothetical protein